MSTSDCQTCCAEDLPVNPFLALRVAFGMLLGEDDFRTLMGNARGKQMLHSAWLHGSGVVWGYRVKVDGEWTLRVSPGLAVDGLGRELLAETSWCLDVRDWLRANHITVSSLNEGEQLTVTARLVAEFGCCPTAPVPTLADPCDITRKHDDWSRVVETVRLSLVPGPPPPTTTHYQRIRVLLGLIEAGDDQAGKDALDAAKQVAAAPPAERARELLRQFKSLAAADAADLSPATEYTDEGPTLFPVTEAEAGVELARVEIVLLAQDDVLNIHRVRVLPEVRSTLLPTSLIQELTCGLAPGLLGPDARPDAGGPRVLPDSLSHNEDGTLVAFDVTAPLNARSLRRAIRITSLSAERGWVDEDIDNVQVTTDNRHVVVELAGRLTNHLVRLVVRGTGSEPAFGVDPAVPLAGVVGGPPGSSDDGHDAVLTLTYPITPRRAEG
jgi:hypothetical protein